MSQDIVDWQTLKQDNLVIPLANFDSEWYRTHNDSPEEPEITFTLREQVEISGTLILDKFFVSEVSCFGEGSGRVFYDEFSKVFEGSSGVLKAAIHWEGCAGGEYFESVQGETKTEELSYVAASKEKQPYTDWDIFDHAIEEMGEVLQAISKLKRYGPYAYNPEDPSRVTNKDQLLKELVQCRVILKELIDVVTPL